MLLSKIRLHAKHLSDLGNYYATIKTPCEGAVVRTLTNLFIFLTPQIGCYQGKGAKQMNLVQNHITVTLRFRKNIFGQNVFGQWTSCNEVGPNQNLYM